MAAADRGGEELHGLLGELLSLGYALGRGQRASLLVMVFALFAIELGPLGLVTGLEESLAGRRAGAHANNLTLAARRRRLLSGYEGERRNRLSPFGLYSEPEATRAIANTTVPAATNHATPIITRMGRRLCQFSTL